MTLSVAKDGTKPDGGYAILKSARLMGVSALSVQNCFSGMYLGEDGRWSKTRFACPVDSIEGQPDAVSLGPHIVDFIPTDLQVAFRDEAGDELGQLVWADISPSRNPGGRTSKDVLKDRHVQTEQAVQKTKPDETKTDPDESNVESGEKRRASPLGLSWWVIGLIVLCAATIVAFLLWHRLQQVEPSLDGVHTSPAKTEQVAPAKKPPSPVARETTPSEGCSANGSDDFERGLQKYAGDELHDLTDAETLLKCAIKAGKAEAKFNLARLYIKMATAIDWSYQERRGFYRKACDLGDQEGCEKFEFKLH